MVHDVLATKIGMTQAWTKDGKRVCVTRLHAADMMVVGNHTLLEYTVVELGVGQKKLKNTVKPLRSRLEKSGFLVAPQQVRGVRVTGEDTVPAVGTHIRVIDMLAVGDVVTVQGITKGKGFAGVVKRHGFAGGPKTHGQSDRHRAPGSIGNRTTPGRVFKNKRMAGHMGVDLISIKGLTVLYIDPEKLEVWVSGPVPGSYGSVVKLQKTGNTKKVTLDAQASGTVDAAVSEEAGAADTTATTEVAEPTVETPAETATTQTDKKAETTTEITESAASEAQLETTSETDDNKTDTASAEKATDSTEESKE